MMPFREATITPDNYRFLQEHIRRESGIVLDDSKLYLLEARLLPVAREAGLCDLDELCGKLRLCCPSPLNRLVIEAMTVNETYFFREPAHFELLKEIILPLVIAERRDCRNLSLWSAAASTGQEAYSLAMLLSEVAPPDWSLSVVGTDLSENVLGRARQGKYTQLEVNRGLPPAMLAKYFKRRNLLWEVRPAISDIVRFQSLDLRKTGSTMGPFDVVLCRNVLIYFEISTKLQIVDLIRATIAPNGFLLLGASDVGLPLGSRFKRLCARDVTYYQAV